MMTVGTTLDRFLAKFVVQASGCWEWTASRDRRGYGHFKVLEGNSRFAHRWSYQHFVGPIPDGLELDHLCVNPSCVNPDHLEPVTRAENQRRRLARMTACHRGHPFDEANTYRPYEGRRVCRACHRLWQAAYLGRRRAEKRAA